MNDSIVHQEPCPPRNVTYEGMLRALEQNYSAESVEARRRGVEPPPFEDVLKSAPSRSEFAQSLAYQGFECLRVTYLSDGLRVVGYVWKPIDSTSKELPLIIYNRGGNQEFGKLNPWVYSGFYAYLREGFVVIGSQYRGNDGVEGKEEFGGADIHDVLNLMPLAESLGYIDMRNVFVQGDSRGGMMTYLALKQRMPVNAAAVVSGLGDLAASVRERPEFEVVYSQLIPDFATRRGEAMRERSVVAWAGQIDTPILILHGTADWRTQVDSQGRAVSQALTANGKQNELVVYDGDVHGLLLNGRDRTERILAWFKLHMR